MAIIGIDLGTTNSLCSCWQDGKAQLIVNANKKHQTPSVVGFDDQGQIIVGQAAKERLLTHPTLTTATFKRFMGSNREVTLGKKKFRAEELSALVLKSLKADAEAYLGETVTEAVISVPAYFNDAQRKATKTAGTLAGLEVKRLINEPTAAAIAYGLHQNEQDDNTFLIFDIGGGTFDVSILEMFDGVMQVNASAGDNFLGGEDFVDALMEHFCRSNGLRIDKLKGNELALLRQAAQRCKLNLSKSHEAEIKIHLGPKQYQYEYSRDKFHQLTKGLIERLRQPLQRAISDADISSADIDAVVMVGGSSRMPQIRSMASKLMGKIPATTVNPDEVIAVGCAIQVGLILDDQALNEVVLTDVSPFTLGVEIHNEYARGEGENLYHPVIERNAPVPVSRMDNFVTCSDNQSFIQVGIYQGESRLVKDNVKLGELNINVPKNAKGQEAIEVRFTYDINGLLEVEGKVTSTGLTTTVVIEGNPGTLSPDEVKQRLEQLQALKTHPRDQLENTTLLARAGRLFEQSLGDKRLMINDVVRHFESVLHRQDAKEITTAAKEFEQFLDEVETTLDV